MKEYKVTSGDLMFSDRFPMGGSVTMRDEVDRKILEKAVNIAAGRLPFMATELVSHDAGVYLRENGKPFVVTEGDTPLPLGSPEANGHEFSYSCQGNRIYFLYNHMLCDGHGYAMVNDTVVRSYCRLRYGVRLEGGLVSMNEAPTGEEYADPYAYAQMPDPPIPHFEIPTAFMPPEEDMRRDGSALIRRIRVPKEDVFCLLRTLEGSPAALAALLLCRAFDAVYPEHDETILATTAVDTRAALGCRKTVQNCLVEAVFVYSDKVKKMSLDRQMTCFRGMLLRQTDPDYLREKMADQASIYEYMTQLRREGKAAPAAMSRPRPLFVTYVGNVGLGELDEYRKELTMSGLSTGAVTLGMTEKSGVFHLDMVVTLKSERVLDAFLLQLKEVGLPCDADPTETLTLKSF